MARGAVIVTGGAGYIGSHACKRLAAAGYLPVTVDNLSTGHANAVRWGPLERLDVRETGALADVLARYGSGPVMHFAASAFLVPLALMAAGGTGPALHIFGRDYPTPDGTCIRDYIHVSDLAEAHLAALTHLDGGGDNLALNLGTGKGLSILDICGAIERVTGHAVPVEDAPRRPGDPPQLVADASEAAKRLGFRTRRSEIEAIVRAAAPRFGVEVRHDANA